MNGPRATPTSVSGWLDDHPRRSALADVAGTVALASIALLGFRSTFGDDRALLAGLVGVLVSVSLVLVFDRFAIPPAAQVLAVIVAFVVAGGVAVPDAAIGGFLPGLSVPGAIGRGLVESWNDLLTTAPPVGMVGGLGVVPYLGGWIAGGLGLVLARRTSSALLPAAPAAVVLLGALLLGTVQPSGIVVQGVAFATFALLWGSVRAGRAHRTVSGDIDWSRVARAGVMLIALSTVGLVLSSSLPGFRASDRYVLRDDQVPPFDPRDYPSPLGGFRTYVDESREKTELLTVTGLPKGAAIRLSTMDTYDGVVWIVGGEDQTASGRFERVGTSILPVPPGTSARLEVEVEGYEGVWVPAAGSTRTISFEGGRAADLARALRYNATTGVAATPLPLARGDRYTVDLRLPVEVDEKTLAKAVPDQAAGLPALPRIPDEIRQRVSDMVGSASTPYEQAKAIETYLFDNGFYSDGGPKDTGAAKSPPGHSLGRLRAFLANDAPVGNAEQYAAAMALLARSIGLPARVVLGFRPASDGGPTVVRGEDADAWVEIAFEGIGWQEFHPTPNKDKVPKEQPKPKPQEVPLEQQEPRVRPYLEPPDPSPELAKQKIKPPKEKKPEGALSAAAGIPVLAVAGVGVPVLLVGGVVGAILGLKRLRSSRRRSATDEADRLRGAWAELIDHLRDRGSPVPHRATRREVATAVEPVVPIGLGSIAAEVDAGVFGPEPPTGSQAEAVWAQVEQAKASSLAALGPRARLRTKLSIKSLVRQPERNTAPTPGAR